jgi:hypothetical protein
MKPKRNMTFLKITDYVVSGQAKACPAFKFSLPSGGDAKQTSTAQTGAVLNWAADEAVFEEVRLQRAIQIAAIAESFHEVAFLAGRESSGGTDGIGNGDVLPCDFSVR